MTIQELINRLRNAFSPNAITPEALGYILQAIYNLIIAKDNLVGDKVPTSTDGVNGNFYFDKSAKILYIKANGAWIPIISSDSGGTPIVIAQEEGNSLDIVMSQNAVSTLLETIRQSIIDKVSTESLNEILANYYLKTSTYSKEEVNGLINAINGFTPRIVLSVSEVVSTKYIYFISTSGVEEENNKYDEYLFINGKAEKIGTFSANVDLSQFVTIAMLNMALSDIENTYSKKVDTYTREEGKRLITEQEATKLASAVTSQELSLDLQEQKSILDAVDINLQGQIDIHSSQIQDIVSTYINNKGYFATLTSLQASHPTPEIGDIAYVADALSTTGYYIYNVVDGIWTSSTVEAPPVAVPIGDYTLNGGSSKTLKEVTDELALKIDKLDVVGERSQSTTTVPSSKLFDDVLVQVSSDLNENKNSILANLLFDFDFSQIIEFNKSNNFYINQNGQAVANSDCVISDFIDCTKAKYIMPYFYIYFAGYCAYYSEANESSFISSFQVTNSDFGNLKDIPTGANYIRLSAFITGSVQYKNDYPIAIIVGNNKKNPSLPIIQKSDIRNVKVNGAICSLQRWGSIAGQYLKLKFPDSSIGLSQGISYVFDLTIRKLERNTASKNNFLKLRVELLRYSTEQYTPSVTYVAGNSSLINNVKLYYEMDGGNIFRIPSVVIDNSDVLLGVVVDNMNISAVNNVALTESELSAFTLTEETSIGGLTLINDYSAILLEDNLPMTKAQGKASFISIDNSPSKMYDYTIYSSQVDPETGESNYFYRTIYKRKVNGENRIVAKVWGSASGHKMFRAFDVNGNVIASYSRDTQAEESNVILTLDITLTSNVDSYSISYVTNVVGTPDPNNASFSIFYTDISKYIDIAIQPQIDTLSEKIENGYKYIDIKNIGKILSDFNKLANTEHDKPLNLLFVGDSIVNFQNAWKNGETAIYYNKPLCMYNPNTFTNRIWELLNPGALYYDKTAKTYGGAMTFLKTNPTPGDLTPSDGVTISGSGWLSNVSGSGYNELGDCGGYPVAGWHEFLFSKNQGDYIEFSVPSGIFGFSVVIECSTSNRSSDGTNFYGHAQSVEVYFNGNLQGIVNTSDKNGNIRFDFNFNDLTTMSGVVKILLNESNKWLGIWGIETWSSKFSVRPINNGLASHSIVGVYSKYERAISSANPDLIIFCGMLNNDSGLTETQVQQYYDLMWDELQLLNKPIIGISTHWGTYNRMYYNPADMNHDDPRHEYSGGVWNPKGYHPAYLRIFLNWCKEYNIPIINPCQYMYDEYGDDSTPFMVDVAHLNVAGHNLYKRLIDTSMIGNY